ncbi:ORF6C domain-containing protein [Paenibacillus sp. FSL E2-0190]|uniref:ORF6C domain-containing protein n=1 Tax=Paenibacillus sp. FSL E2-0190 TaxID=2954504 RepID=UPI0030EBE339
MHKQIVKAPVTINSREVAIMTDVRHSDLLRSISGYIRVLENAELRSQDFFIPSIYKVEGNNKNFGCFELTRKGCDMVANKMTGEKGILFTAAYVTKFEAMEEKFKNPFVGASKELQAILMLDIRTKEMEDRVEHLENRTTIDYGQQRTLKKAGNKRVLEIVGGKKSAAYKDSSLRTQVYSALWNEFTEFFEINSYNNTFIKDYDRALNYVPHWNPPNNLMRQIEQANGQMLF